MRVLLDHCVPQRFAAVLVGHDVATTASQGWAALKNGELLREAAKSFEVFITIDRSLPKQQNLAGLPLPVVLILVKDNRFATIEPLGPEVLKVLDKKLEKRVYVVDAEGLSN